MSYLKRYSLVWRLLALVGVAYVVTAAAVFLLLDHLVHQAVENGGRQDLTARLEILARTLEREAERAEAADPATARAATLAAFAAVHAGDPANPVAPFLLDADGTVLAHLGLAAGERPPALEPATGPAPHRTTVSETAGEQQWVVATTIRPWNWTVGYQASREMLRANADRVSRRMAAVWAGVGLLVLAILAVALRRETRPLLELAHAADDMADGHLDREVQSDLPGEIGTVARGFENLRDAIRGQLAELRESESRYRRIFDAMADALLLLDQDGTIVAANPRAAATFGWSPPQLVNRPVASLLRENDRELAQALRSPPADRPLTLDGITCNREGQELETEISAVRLSFQGQAHSLVILRVVAKQRQLERQLLQAQKLESVGRLAGGIAHDFNNLLTPVLGYTEMLLDGDGFDEESRADLAAIRRAGERARNLARQLLAFSRRQVLVMQDIDLGHTLAEFEPILRRTLREDIELVLRIGDAGRRVRADTSQIEQTLMNLAINSMDAMPDGGRIEFETGVRSITPRDLDTNPDIGPGDYVCLVVRDTGSGIPPEIIERVTEPFFTTKDAGKGTGLGLATTHGIVQQHGGQLSVRNGAGGGCEVTILLPCLPAAAGADEGPGAESAKNLRGDGAVVLLVEDDDMVRELVERLLARHGYAVRAFATGDDCLEALADDPEPADVLLTDVVMPGIDGPELRDRLRAAGRTLPTLFMSGYAGDTLLRRGLADARADFLQKPISPEVLLRKLHAILKRSKTV